jgi:large subunit ribosomal protein L18
MAISKTERRQRIKYRIRKKLSGTPECPRLSVFRSNKQIYAQLIDDLNGKTLMGMGSLSEKDMQKGNKQDQAASLGKAFAAKAQEAGYTQVVFDRNGFLYHGRVKSFADAAREAGLKF